MSALAILLMMTAAPARADLAGACAYTAGLERQESDCRQPLVSRCAGTAR